MGPVGAASACQALVTRCNTPGWAFGYHTTISPLERSFDAFQPVLADFENSITGWPWCQSIVASKKNSGVVKKAVFAGATQVLGRLRFDEGLIKLSRQSYQCVLQELRQALANREISHGQLLTTIECSFVGIELLEYIGLLTASKGLPDTEDHKTQQRASATEPDWVWHWRTFVITFEVDLPHIHRL